MRTSLWFSAALGVSCAAPSPALPPLPPPSPPAPIRAAEPPEADVTESSPRDPDRRGECRLADALHTFLGDGPVVRCGELARRATLAEHQDARACILEAIRGEEPFFVLLHIPGIDSSFERAFAGRPSGADYETRQFDYDSCPMGCGDTFPVWSSVRCNPLLDGASACKDPKTVERHAMRGFCERLGEGPGEVFGDPRTRATVWLGLFCASGSEPVDCPVRWP